MACAECGHEFEDADELPKPPLFSLLKTKPLPLTGQRLFEFPAKTAP